MNNTWCIYGKDYKLTNAEFWCFDEIKNAAERFGLDKDKCLSISSFRLTEERKAIFDRIWNMIFAKRKSLY